MLRTFLFALHLFLFAGPLAHAQPTRHVILISIDGFHSDMYLDPSWPAPNLRQLVKKDTATDHLSRVFPKPLYTL